jgi:ribonuclease-3 family protein
MEKEFLNATIDKQQAREMNPLVLAFIGDSIQMLYVRKRLALSHGVKSGKLHKLALLSVSAAGQADTLESIKDFLTQEETEIYKRARNSKTASAAKNAKITDYRKATGLEAVLGYLYITGQSQRLEEILDLSFKETSEG